MNKLRVLKPGRKKVPLHPCTPSAPCDRCVSDRAFLRSPQRPTLESVTTSIRAADLFAGCGGMTLGMQEAARRSGSHLTVALAVENDSDVVEIYSRNIAGAAVKTEDVTTLFDGSLGAPLTDAERKLTASVGTVTILLGGPPCQGHSDLNNHTRRNDPKNALYLRLARAAEVLKPDIVVIENVAPVQWDQSGVVAETTKALTNAGFTVESKVLDLRHVGVPQCRRRFVLLASRIAGVEPSAIFKSLIQKWGNHPARTVDWAIRDLLDVESDSILDTPSRKTKKNARRMAYLFEKGVYNLPNKRRPKCHRKGGHSYVSVYGRLRWDRPAQTITTGFGCMGQGRYVHPQRRRTITPHEAARLQAFPDWFDFDKTTRRGVLAKAIGNAVPPLLMVELGQLLIAALDRVAAAQPKRA